MSGDMKTIVIAGGFYCLAFAVFHLCFWRLFGWKSELRKLNEINRGIMQVLNLRLTYVLAVFSALAIFFPAELLTPGVGRFILGAIALFWLMRAAEQLVFWRRNKAGLLFFAVFLAGALLFGLPFMMEP